MHRAMKGTTTSRSARLAALIASVVLVFVMGASAASAQSDFAEQVAAQVDDGGFAVEDGAELDEADARRLARDLDDQVGFVVLAQGITPSAQSFADEVYDLLARSGSVVDVLVVVTPDELGATVSERYGPGAAGEALDAVDPSASAAEVVSTFANELADLGSVEPTSTNVPETTPTPAQSSTAEGDGGGGGGFLIFLLVLLIGGGLLYFVMKRSGAKKRAVNLEKARAEVEGQLNGLGSLIYDLDARLKIEGEDTARRRFEQASSDYADLKREIADADSGPEVADVASRVDDVKWSLEAVEADLDGRPLPPRPVDPVPSPQPDRPSERAEPRSGQRRGPDLGPLGRRKGSSSRRRPIPGGDVPSIERSTACLFDPSHRAGSVPVTIESSRGDQSAFICRACARRLESGERPNPRLVDIGQRQVAAAAAPTGYGGLGLSLPDLFKIKTGSMTEGLDYDWGREIDRPSSAGVSRRRRRTEALPGSSSAGRRRSR